MSLSKSISFETLGSGKKKSSYSSSSLESMSSTKAISHEDVINLEHSFKSIIAPPPGTKKSFGSSSQETLATGTKKSFNSKTIDLKTILDPGSSVYKFLFGCDLPPPLTNAVDSVVLMKNQTNLDSLDTMNPLIICEECSQEHPHFSCCPNMPCSICYKDGHVYAFCPYQFYIPQGADFDRAKYQVVCRSCDFPIDTDTWLCTYCYTAIPKLEAKYCEICEAIEDHITVECPNDKALAAIHKSELDALIINNRNRTPCAEYLAAKRARESSQRDS